MTFVESVKKCLFRDVCRFSGRASRSEYWWFILFLCLLGGVSGLVSPRLPRILDVFFFLPFCAVSVRRLHDSGLSGLFLFVICPAVLVDAIALLVDVVGIGGETAVVLYCAGLGCNVYLCCRRSDPGRNRYGLPCDAHPEAHPEDTGDSEDQEDTGQNDPGSEQRTTTGRLQQKGQDTAHPVHRIDLEKNAHSNDIHRES